MSPTPLVPWTVNGLVLQVGLVFRELESEVGEAETSSGVIVWQMGPLRRLVSWIKCYFSNVNKCQPFVEEKW